jgi:hypothetical protein
MNYLRRSLQWLAPSFFLKDTRTVHYAFSMLFFVATAISMASVIGSKESYITLTTPNPLVEAGQTFAVDVAAFAHTPVNALNLTITFPTDMVEILGVDRGESVITLWTEDPKIVGNSVTLSGGTYRNGFVGEHHIATINVRAKKTGQATFIADKAELLAGDGQGTAVEADLSASKLNLKILSEAPATLDSKAVLVIVTDINSDGKVGLDDISSFMAAWATRDTKYDFNNDGAMTFRDFSIILAEYFSS